MEAYRSHDGTKEQQRTVHPSFPAAVGFAVCQNDLPLSKRDLDAGIWRLGDRSHAWLLRMYSVNTHQEVFAPKLRLISMRPRPTRFAEKALYICLPAFAFSGKFVPACAIMGLLK